MSDRSPVDTRDARWGRTPGARPPLPRWRLVAFSLTSAILLSLVVIFVVRPAGALDQPDLAYQRDGLLRAGPTVPPEMSGVRFGGRPVVLLFVREPPEARQLPSWRNGLPGEAAVFVVLQAGGAAAEIPSRDLTVVEDPTESLAAAVGLPAPNDNGPGIGYAIVDSERVVRYSTLDPRWYDNAFEVATIVGAVS